MKNTLLSLSMIKSLFERRFWRRELVFGLAALLLGAFSTFAQAPDAFTFQGVARDANGKIYADAEIFLTFNIFKDSPSGILVSQDVAVPVITNANGVFNATIKGKQVITGTGLNESLFGQGKFFLNVQMLPPNGDQTDLGTTELLSVPFALVANKLPDLDPIAQIGQLGSGKSIIPEFLDSSAPSFIWYPKNNAFKVGTGAEDEDSFAENSVALGTGVLAKIPDGTALGRFNDLNNNLFQGVEFQRLFQIGNGSASNSRKNALTILKSGNVGIGSNVLEPDHLLDLGGRMRIKHANNQTAGLFLDGAATKEAAFIGMKLDSEVGFFIGGGWKFWVNSGGEGFLTNILHDSDRRLKRDFAPLSNSLFKIDNLQGQHYYWKDTTKTQLLQTGLIAQDVEEYFPELVTTNEKGFKSVNYIGLIPHLIESVRALKAKDEEFAALQKELIGYKSLQNQIDELKAELSKQAASANSTNQTTQTK